MLAVQKMKYWALLVALQCSVVVVSIPLGVFLAQSFSLLPQWLLTTFYL